MIVTMPDGIDVEFPDDMPREKIKGIIEKKYPKEVGEFKGIDVSKLDVNNVMSDDGLNSQPSSKIDVMLSVAKLITPKDSELGRFVRRADWGVRTIENTDFSKLGTEGAKSAGRAINASVVGGTGFLVKMAGDMFYPEYNAKDYEADTVFTRVKKFKDDSNRAVFGAIRDFGQSVQDFSERVNTSEYLKADEKLFAGDWEQNPNLHKVTDLIMSGATSVVGAYVMSSVAGPAAGLMLFSGIDAKDLYEEAREKGVSKGKAFGTWLAGTAGTAYLEKFGVESAFGVKIGRGGMTKIVDATKSTTSKITDAMLANAGEEYLQTVWQNLSAKVGYDEGRDIFQNAVESAVGGAFGGGLVASFNFGYQAFKSKSQKAGLTQQEQDNVITAVGQAIANNPDMVDVPFQENMKKTYASFQQMIKELGDTPEAERLKETKRQLDEVYSKTFEQLKDKMPEKQAKAVSDIARSSALFFSDLEGMSVGEWFEKNAPQIKKVDSIENEIRQFAKNIEPIKTRLDLEDINLFEALKNPDIVKRYREKDTRSSLLQFIKKRGGAVDAGGELKAMDIGKNVIGAINNKSGESLDDLALAAWENGYFPEKTERPTVNELLEAIRDESFGKKRYAEEKQADLEDVVADLSEALDRMNIDYQNMTAQEIEQAYNDYLADMEERSAMNAEYADEASRAEDIFDLSYFQVADENQRLDDIYPAYEGETININGQEKTVYNSNGDRIAKSKEALENFYKWFGNSKVVDEQGRPKVMYHGTPNAIYDTLQAGTYFTDNKDYAEVYKGQGASSISYKKEAQKPDVYAVYLKMEKPFDTRNKEARDDFYKYYYQQMGMGTDLTEMGLPDWMDGRDLLDFITEEHPELGYDGLILDEGGVGGYGEPVVSRGFSYVTARDDQAKSTSNRGTYSESKNIHYQWEDIGSKTRFSKSKSDLKKLLSMFPPRGDYRLMYDADKRYWFVTDSMELIHQDILKQAWRSGLYPEFSREWEVQNFFDEKTYEDDTLYRFVAQGYENNNYMEKIENMGDDYTVAYVVPTKDDNGVVIFARGLGELADAGVGYLEENAKIYDVQTKEEIKPETYYQSAFAGSRVDYDRPSLEAIGSGEGNQAHGWGLYYALNKDVAEGYKNFFEGQKATDAAYLADYKSFAFYLARQYGEKGKIVELLNKRIAEAETYLEVADIKDGVQRDIEKYKKALEYVNKNSVDSLKREENEIFGKAQVHEVDIPENPYLLDEQKTFKEQSLYVKKQLRKAFKDIGQNLSEVMKTGYVKGNPTGGQLYGELMSFLGGDAKNASLHLEKHGIKGITYDGKQDGRCFVIFNPADVKVIQKFYQGEQSPLGAYVNRIIYLSKNANASTLPHELAHFWSDMLRSSKSLRAKEILREVDKWANKEFDRKFSTIKTENGYAVVDKSGKTVYDRMGEGFATEEQARAYAKEELFARGFEKYLREGKAPNKTLRQAFANFYNWLKKIYSDMMSLDIKLSKPMRDVYANILGGTSIDTFLDSNIDQFIERRAEAEQDKDIQVREIIQQAQGVKPVTLPEKIRKAYEEFDFGETWKKIMIPLSTRAKRVAPTLRNKIRRYEFDVLETKQAYYREIEPMLKKWQKFSKEDSIAFDLALKNGATDIRDELLRKYGATEDFAKVTETLDDIYYKANDAGLEVGYIEDYFPRKVKDKDGLLSYLRGTDEWSGFQEALHREDPHGQFSAEEQAEFIDKYLRGIVRADLAAYKYSSEKARKLDTIDNVLNQYYADSMQALIAYIDGMNARISTVNFFGRNRENVDESIGEFVAYLLNNNEIKPSQVDEVKSILNAVFKRRGVGSKWIKAGRDMSYIYTMGGVNTAITQLDDIFVAAYKGGVINTFSAAFQKDRVTKKDLGLDSIAAEFVEGSGVSKAVNWVFKHNGIELIDGFGKNALLNGVLKKMEQMSDADLRKYLEPVMEEETEQTMKDIRNGELSANVRFFLFNELSDMQPVSLSELPELYNVGGNARIFYMLKSFMLKRIDTLRNEVYDKMRSSDQATRIEGWKNMYRLILLMMLGGATKDLIIDLMYNRAIDLNDTVVNNLLGMVGISKYNIYQVREEGMGHTLAIFATPPLFSVAEDLSGDVNKYISGKREFKDFEVFKGLPIIGRFYYWLYGGGKTKTEKKKKKQR